MKITVTDKVETWDVDAEIRDGKLWFNDGPWNIDEITVESFSASDWSPEDCEVLRQYDGEPIIDLEISKQELIDEIQNMQNDSEHPGICIQITHDGPGIVCPGDKNTDDEILWIENDGAVIDIDAIDWDADKCELERQLNEGWPGHFTVIWTA